MSRKFKVKKDDEVIVISGPQKGKRGKIIKMIPKEERVIVEGVNVAKRHRKPGHMQAGGIEQKEAPIHVSNVALVDPKEDKPTRVGVRVLEDGRRVRFAKRSGEVIDS